MSIKSLIVNPVVRQWPETILTWADEVPVFRPPCCIAALEHLTPLHTGNIGPFVAGVVGFGDIDPSPAGSCRYLNQVSVEDHRHIVIQPDCQPFTNETALRPLLSDGFGDHRAVVHHLVMAGTGDRVGNGCHRRDGSVLLAGSRCRSRS